MEITPNIIYIRQQQNQIRAVDIYAELNSTGGNSLIVGAMYRLDDAVVAEFGYHINNTMIGISYDINTSPLNTVTNGHGGLELSLNYIFGSRSASSSSSTPGF